MVSFHGATEGLRFDSTPGTVEECFVQGCSDGAKTQTGEKDSEDHVSVDPAGLSLRKAVNADESGDAGDDQGPDENAECDGRAVASASSAQFMVRFGGWRSIAGCGMGQWYDLNVWSFMLTSEVVFCIP